MIHSREKFNYEAFALLKIYNEMDSDGKIFRIWLLWRQRRYKKKKVEEYREKKFCSTTRGSSDGWKDEGKKMYNALVHKIKELRKDPATGRDFEQKLMVRWIIEKKQLMEKIWMG